MNNISYPKNIDVLCVGATSFDLTFLVDQHPNTNEKAVAKNLLSCGGGPAANAAVCVANLGLKSALAGYLGNDPYGELHLQELKQVGVITDYISKGNFPTPVSAVIVKPNGNRALVNYKENKSVLKKDSINFSNCRPKVILFDGHEPEISSEIIKWAKDQNIITLLDAGSLHEGTKFLMDKVDYLASSEKFALQVTKKTNPQEMLSSLSQINSQTVITFGEKGLLWKMGSREGELAAFNVDVIDTTGAGDAFHGAFAYCLAKEFNWHKTLEYSNAVAALCCTKMGARTGMPLEIEVENFLNQNGENRC